MNMSYNISKPAKAAAVVFGMRLSAQAAFRLDPEDRDPQSTSAGSLDVGC